MAGGLEIVALGVGDAFSALHYSTCLAVNSPEGFWLIDCPHPILKMLHEANTDSARPRAYPLVPKRLLGVILTHLHADHCSGLESLAYYSFFVLGKKLRLLCHPDVSARLWPGCLAAGMEQLVMGPGRKPIAMSFDDYFELQELKLDGKVEALGLEVECRPTFHHIPTTAVRIYGESSRFGYSADTYYDEALIRWLADSDVFYHETGPGIHTPLEKLVALPEDVKSNLRLIHYPDGLIGNTQGLARVSQSEGLLLGGPSQQTQAE